MVGAQRSRTVGYTALVCHVAETVVFVVHLTTGMKASQQAVGSGERAALACDTVGRRRRCRTRYFVAAVAVITEQLQIATVRVGRRSVGGVGAADGGRAPVTVASQISFGGAPVHDRHGSDAVADVLAADVQRRHCIVDIYDSLGRLDTIAV